jgi:aquaporin Z
MGATLPGKAGIWPALAAETVATFLAVSLIVSFVEKPRLMPFTPAAAGLLGAVLTYTTIGISGASLNPARSAGPALVGDTWGSLWIYLLAPAVGALAAAALHRHHTIPCGKLFHDATYVCHFKDCLYERKPEVHDHDSSCDRGQKRSIDLSSR